MRIGLEWSVVKNSLYGLSVNLNGLYIPARIIEDHLTRHCTSLGVLTDIDGYPIYVPGSATLIRYKHRFFMVCTRHQLKDTPDLGSVCLLIPHSLGQTKCISSGGASWFDQYTDGDHQQIVIFDFTEPCRDIPELKSLFFDFRQQHSNMPAEKVVAFITYGYLTDEADFYYGNGNLQQVKARVLSKLAAAGADDALHVIAPISPLDFDPDGMSGGPSFCVIHEGCNEFSVHFAGVTVRASNKRIRLIKAGAIQATLDAIIRD